MVRMMRFERTRVAPLPPEDSVSAISPHPQEKLLLYNLIFLKRNCNKFSLFLAYFLKE